jgi:hypothetical protein
MARYIDADVLLNELKEELEFDSPMLNDVENKWLDKGIRIAIKTVKRCPTANVAPIADTVSKMAERIKLEFYREFDEIIPSIMADRIDQIAKEMLEGKDNG